MPDFAGSKTQLANIYAELRAPQTPQPGLQPGLHRETTLCFSASTCRQDGHARHPRQPANSFPVTAGQRNSLQSTTLSGNYYFPPGASRPTAFRRISFHTSPHNLPLARNLHSGLTGQYIPALILSLFFFHSALLHTKKETGKADFHLFFFVIQNLVQI